jgi:hypothetical protein
MQTYVILRRSGWRSPDELEAAAERPARVGDEEMADTVGVRPDPEPATA